MKFINIGLVMVYSTSKITSAFNNLRNFLEERSLKPEICDSIVSLAKCIARLDCIIVVGGDGSMLAISSIAAEYQIPVIGVHYGKLGFLSDINPENLSGLLHILQGDFQREERVLLKVNTNNSDEASYALNEVAINRKVTSHLLSYEIYADDKLICHQRSDGVLIHTPTGSTAYALSAGGPIMQPLVNAFGIVPLNPHRLNTRPIVLINNQKITVKLDKEDEVSVSVDGNHLDCAKVTNISICKAKHNLILLHPSSYDYFEKLRQKLHWEL